MTAPLTSVFPRPAKGDADDVRWTLQTAAVQWQRGLHAEAIVWVRRAADSALGCGQSSRGDELREQASFLAGLLRGDSDSVPASSSARPLTIEPESLEPGDPDPEEIELLDADVEELTAEELAFLDDGEVQSEAHSAPPGNRSGSEAAPAVHGPHSRPTHAPAGRPMMASIVSSAPAMLSPSAAAPASAPELDLLDNPVPGSVAERVDRALRAPPVPHTGPAPRGAPDSVNLAGVERRRGVPGAAGSHPANPPLAHPPTEPLPGSATESEGSSWPAASALDSLDFDLERATSAPAGPAAAEPGSAFDDVTELSDAASAMQELAAEARNTLLDEPVPALLVSDSLSEDTFEASPPLVGRATEPAAAPAPESVNELSQSRAGGTRFDDVSDATEVSLPGAGLDEPGRRPEVSPSSAPLPAGSLGVVELFSDLPSETRTQLAASGRSVMLEPGQGSFLHSGLCAVLEGSVGGCRDEASQPGVRFCAGSSIAAEGTLRFPSSLYLRAGTGGAHLGFWSPDGGGALLSARAGLRDALLRNADHARARAGAASGELGQQLDESLLSGVLDRFEVRSLPSGQLVAQAGKPVEGLFLVGAGSLAEAAPAPNRSALRWEPGEFVLGQSLVDGSPAACDVSVETSGALLMFAPRAVALELMMSLPPLIEMLAS